MSNKRRVVVTRMGIYCPIGYSVEEFEKNLFAGKSGIRRLSRFEYPPEFKIRIAGEVEEPKLSISKRYLRGAGRFARYALAAAEQALGPGLFLPSDDPRRVGVLIGNGGGGREEGEKAHDDTNKGRYKRGNGVDIRSVCKIMPLSAGGKIAEVFEWDVGREEKFKLRGCNFAPSSACASSGHAIGEGFKKIQHGEYDIMITGGASALLTATTLNLFNMLSALSKNDDPATASRPFDKDRDGFVMGEGAAIVVLEDFDHAFARHAHIKGEILAEIAGYRATCDAWKETAPHPDGRGAFDAMQMALEDAGMKAGDIGYINAHGTSTYHNDRIETLAIRRLYGCEKCLDKIPPVSSTKSQIGHLVGAGGAAEFVATVLALKNRRAPPTINYRTKDPECDLDYVPNKARDLPDLEAAITNSLAFGGSNASIVVKRCRIMGKPIEELYKGL